MIKQAWETSVDKNNSVFYSKMNFITSKHTSDLNNIATVTKASNG